MQLQPDKKSRSIWQTVWWCKRYTVYSRQIIDVAPTMEDIFIDDKFFSGTDNKDTKIYLTHETINYTRNRREQYFIWSCTNRYNTKSTTTTWSFA